MTTNHIKGTLEIDNTRGVVYFHRGAPDGTTWLRICNMPTPIPISARIDVILNDSVHVGYTEDYDPDQAVPVGTTIRLPSGEHFTFVEGHDYELVTLAQGVERRPRISRLGFLWPGLDRFHLDFDARGPDRATGRQFGGTQSLDIRGLLAVSEATRDRAKRYTTRKANAEELRGYGLNLRGERISQAQTR